MIVLLTDIILSIRFPPIIFKSLTQLPITLSTALNNASTFITGSSYSANNAIKAQSQRTSECQTHSFFGAKIQNSFLSTHNTRPFFCINAIFLPSFRLFLFNFLSIPANFFPLHQNLCYLCYLCDLNTLLCFPCYLCDTIPSSIPISL